MLSKPKFLGPEYAMAFLEQGVADAYQFRRSYPRETFTILAELIGNEPRIVLDIGCGTGDIARHLVEKADHIDAVDFSWAMIERGKTLPGGDHPKINWILGRVEDLSLHPPYGLITAGQSIHWMDWNIVLPRFATLLSPDGYLALVDLDERHDSWDADIVSLIRRYSTNQDFEAFDMLAAWERHGLWQRFGEQKIAPVPFRQTVEDYIASFHAHSSLSHARMGQERAAAFDAELRELVAPFAQDGYLAFEVAGRIVWGKPCSPRGSS